MSGIAAVGSWARSNTCGIETSSALIVTAAGGHAGERDEHERCAPSGASASRVARPGRPVRVRGGRAVHDGTSGASSDGAGGGRWGRRLVRDLGRGVGRTRALGVAATTGAARAAAVRRAGRRRAPTERRCPGQRSRWSGGVAAGGSGISRRRRSCRAEESSLQRSSPDRQSAASGPAVGDGRVDGHRS